MGCAKGFTTVHHVQGEDILEVAMSICVFQHQLTLRIDFARRSQTHMFDLTHLPSALGLQEPPRCGLQAQGRLSSKASGRQ